MFGIVLNKCACSVVVLSANDLDFHSPIFEHASSRNDLSLKMCTFLLLSASSNVVKMLPNKQNQSQVFTSRLPTACWARGAELSCGPGRDDTLHQGGIHHNFPIFTLGFLLAMVNLSEYHSAEPLVCETDQSVADIHKWNVCVSSTYS